MNTSTNTLTQKEIDARKIMGGVLKSAARHEVIFHKQDADGVSVHLQWNAYGSGDYDYEVRKSGTLLLKTKDAAAAVNAFCDIV